MQPEHDLPPLIDALARGHAREVIETHISWVLLTGEHAYKIKKPLDLGFVDFTTLERRRHACEEEVRLNRRTAPKLYEGVVPILGTDADPALGRPGASDAEAREFAVMMREFPQRAQLDRQLAEGELGMEDMDAVGDMVAQFHASLTPAPADDAGGGVARVATPVRDNFAALAPMLHDAADRAALTRLRQWSESQLSSLAPCLDARLAQGFVRECHGDLHLSNLVRLPEGIVAFDCIEFDPALRWMDVMSEVAFLVMDLAVRQRTDLGWRYLNRYLEHSGDYGGVAVLRFFIVYLSLVRAKIAAIRSAQTGAGRDETRFRVHVGLADRAIRPRRPVLVVMCGVSGSGKTWLSSRLQSTLPAIRLRSDIERRRLHGVPPGERSGSAPGGGIYDERASQRTYAHLVDSARSILTAGFDLIIDAACLHREQRRLFHDLAHEHTAALMYVHCHAPPELLRQRLAARGDEDGEASEADRAVLDYQLRQREPLDETERFATLDVDTGADVDPLRVAGEIWQRLGRELAG